MTQILASIFDFFKAKNPKIAGLIVLVLGTIVYFLNNGGSDFLGEKAAHIAEYIVMLFLALTGSRTTSFLDKK